jgi:hypothetical protein
MNRNISAALLVLALSYLPGCGLRFFTPREANPVLEDYMGTWPSREIASLATRAGHRVNIARMADGTTVGEHQWQRGEFCMEPPPDAMETVASLFTASASGSATDPKGVKASGDAEFARTMATAMGPMLRRSQGLQWARDNMSFLCNSSINRRLSHAEYLDLTKLVINMSFELIKQEITRLPNNDQLPSAVGAPTAPQHPKTTSVPPAPPSRLGSANPAAGETGATVLGSASPKLEQPRQNVESKLSESTKKSFFQRLWNWD